SSDADSKDDERAEGRSSCSSIFGLLSQLYRSLRDDEHVDIISVVDHWILLDILRWGGAQARRSKAVL
ncbi:hypothetical protein ACJX0J_025567, partial [Zea mays]